MKKIIIALIILIASISNVAAFGSLFETENTLNINGKKIGTWKQIYIEGEKDNILYFGGKNDGERKYYKYENSELIEIDEKSIDYKNMSENDYSILDKKTKTEFEPINSEFGENITTCKITINGKVYGPYKSGNGYSGCDREVVGDKSFYFSYIDDSNNKFINLFTYFNTKKQEVKKQIKANPKIDKILNKFFAKIDKKGEIKAQIIYKKIIKKIDSITLKTKSAKNKELLGYLKVKFEEKIK